MSNPDQVPSDQESMGSGNLALSGDTVASQGAAPLLPKDALSSTPRTDAAIFYIADKYGGNIQLAVSAEFAGQLERELNEALEKNIKLCTSNIDLRAELGQLHADINVAVPVFPATR